MGCCDSLCVNWLKSGWDEVVWMDLDGGYVLRQWQHDMNKIIELIMMDRVLVMMRVGGCGCGGLA